METAIGPALTPPAGRRQLPRFAVVPVAWVVAGLAVVLTALSGRYGFHRDELYFLVAGERLAWGYVDQPPLTPLLARLSVAWFGATPTGLRVVSTLAAVASVVVVALLARELGGDRWVQLLAAGCAAAAGFLLGVGHLVATSSFDVLLWLLISWVVLRLLRTADPRWWLAAGGLVGVSLLNKHLVVLLVVALLAGIAIAGDRRLLASWWLPAAAGLALLIAAPNLWWQAIHDWPQLRVAGGISADDGTENRLMFLPVQLAYVSPVLVPVWIAGLWGLLREPESRWARPLALAYPIACGLVLALGGKGYYTVPLLLVLTAAGCAPVIRWLRAGRARARKQLLGAGLLVAVISSVVISLPVLPPAAVSLVNAVNPEQGEQIGWPALVAAVADGWEAIPPERRDRAVIFTQNYGQAGAIARYGDQFGLPEPYSGHMSFGDWGPPPDAAIGPVLVIYQDQDYPGGRPGFLAEFTNCRQHARVDNGFGVANQEQGAIVTLCTGTTAPWSEIWPSLRHLY